MANQEKKKRKPWCHGGDALFKRGRSCVLDFRYRGREDKENLSISAGLLA